MVRVRKPIATSKNQILNLVEKTVFHGNDLEKARKIFALDRLDDLLERDTANISKLLLSNPRSQLKKQLPTIFSREGLNQIGDFFKYGRISRPEVILNNGCNLVIAHYPTMVVYSPRDGVEPFLEFIRKPNCNIDDSPPSDYEDLVTDVDPTILNRWKLECLINLNIDVCAYVNRLQKEVNIPAQGATLENGSLITPRTSITQGRWIKTSNIFKEPKRLDYEFHRHYNSSHSVTWEPVPYNDIDIDAGRMNVPYTTEVFRSYVSGYNLAFFVNRDSLVILGRAKEVLKYLDNQLLHIEEEYRQYTKGYSIISVYREDNGANCPPPVRFRDVNKNPPVRTRIYKPRKPCECDMSCKRLELKLDRIEKFLGIDQMPAKLPKRLIYPDGEGEYQADNLPKIFEFLIRQIDKAVGYLPQEIKIADNEILKEGDQPVTVKIHSFADFAREMLQLILDMESDADVTNNIAVRCLIELGLIHQSNIQSGHMIDAIVEHLDFKHNWVEKEFPFAFDPYVGTTPTMSRGFGKHDEKPVFNINTIGKTEDELEKMLPALLTEKLIKIKVLKNEEKKTLNQDIKEIKRDTALASAAVSTKADSKVFEQLVESALAMLQMESIIYQYNMRKGLTTGNLRTRKDKK